MKGVKRGNERRDCNEGLRWSLMRDKKSGHHMETMKISVMECIWPCRVIAGDEEERKEGGVRCWEQLSA